MLNRIYGILQSGKRKIALLLAIPILFLSFSTTEHAIYIGVIKIDYQEQDASASIQLKVFSDDLQNALKHELNLATLPAHTALCLPSHLQIYFEKHLQCRINDQPTNFQLNNCTPYKDVHLLEGHLDSIPTWKTFTLKADFLMELFPTQSNIVQLNYQKIGAAEPQTYFGRMTKGNDSFEIEF